MDIQTVPLFDAITILVGVSVFSTGFLSIRMHAKRDRLLERITQIGQHLKDPTTLQGEQYNYGPQLILEEFQEYKEANRLDLIANATAAGNFGVFLLVVMLSALIILSGNWKIIPDLIRLVSIMISPNWELVLEFWGLAAIVSVEFGVVVLGALDVFFIHWDIAKRLKRSFAMNLSNARGWERAGNFDEAMKLYDKIVEDWPATHLSSFLRGKAYMDEGDKQAGDKQANLEKAKQYYTKAHDDFMESSEHFTSSSIYYFAGEASLKAGNYQRALLEATRAITLAPNSARAYILRAKIHKRLGDFRQSRSDRLTARELNPILNSNVMLAKRSNISPPLAKSD
jgi:tetratricopeptide (TPR) repeat protein